MAYLIDVILCVLILLVVLLYTKRGAVKSLYGLISTAVAALAAFLLGPAAGLMWIAPLMGGVENGLSRSGAVYDTVYSTMHKAAEVATGVIDIESMINGIPEAMSSLLVRLGVDLEGLVEKFSLTPAKEADLQELAAQIAGPIVEYVSKSIGVVLLFVIVALLMRLLKGLILPLMKLPVLKQADRLLGFVVGVVCAFIYTWVLCVAVSAAVELGFLGEVGAVTASLAEKSYIFRFFCSLSPWDLVNIISDFEKK